ncbi:MAG: hypothetical protein JO250_14310 [Armatimonadetes bacterium]|nr:hypothetical protein [Armatimonadota bacterium]
MDKTYFSIASLDEESDEVEYWRAQSPQARMEALEFLRQVTYGYDPDTARLQRVITVMRVKPTPFTRITISAVPFRRHDIRAFRV